MPDGNDKIAAQPTDQVLPRDEAQIDTERGSSPQTTLPDFVPIGVGLPNTGNMREDRTMAYPTPLSGSVSPAVSYGSFAGTLGRFHYVRGLGEGAYGIVLQVWDPELQAHRAIKVPHRHLIESRRVDPEDYVREVRKIAQLGKHAGIVEVLDVQRMDNGTPFIVSEYISGGSLADRIKKGRMTWQQAVELIAQVAEAIGHAHSKGVVHRDLKPGNILLTDEGRPVVVDFGLALGDDDFSYQASVCGTYQYMSPQQVRGEADRVDGRSDVFSLGVILYQLLSGRMPYKSRDVPSLKREILQDVPTPVRQYDPGVPKELELICRKAMAKEPADRYSTAADFAAALRSLLAESAATGQPAKSDSSVARWAIPLLVGGGVLVMLGLFVMDRSWFSGGGAPSLMQAPGGEQVDPDLTIQVQKSNQDGPYSEMMTSADLPLQVGDKLQFHIELPEPRYVYLYGIDFRGHADRFWPEPDADLSHQSPTTKLTRPAGADATSQPEWYRVDATGGPEAIFVGISKEPLEQNDLNKFESHAEFLIRQLSESDSLAEIEYPLHPENYVLIDGVEHRTRGLSKIPFVSPKTDAVGFRELQKLFSAYHGWIFQTEKLPETAE